MPRAASMRARGIPTVSSQARRCRPSSPREVSRIAAKLKSSPGSLFDALVAAFTERLGPDVHIEKIGFAKEVVAALGASRALEAQPGGFAEVERNFGLILAELAKRLHRANQEEQDRRLNNPLNRTIGGFLADYPTPTTRERGRLLVEEVEASAGNSDEGDRVRLLAEKLRRDFDLDEDLTEPIERYDEFRERVEALRYEDSLASRIPRSWSVRLWPRSPPRAPSRRQRARPLLPRPPTGLLKLR